ncbi:MAG: EamA family transporter [Nitrospinota bacterium]
MDARTLTYTAFSVIGFGIWGFLMNLGQERLGALSHLTAMGLIVAIIVVMGLSGGLLPLPEFNPHLWLPLGAALATMAAMLFLTLALGASGGNTAAVVALSALYPGITAILGAIFLGEGFSLAKIAGLCCGAAAAYLFTR